MPLKIKITLECGECLKRIPIKGKTFTRYSRRHGSTSGIYLPDVYVVESPAEYDGFNTFQVSRGYSMLGRDDIPGDDEGLVCSLICAKSRFEKMARKLKPEKIEKEE